MSSFSARFLTESAQVIERLDGDAIERMAEVLSDVRQRGGRLFFLGIGGGAGHAGHAVNDFRKLAGFEAYAPTDNVSELTARVNDEGWDTSYSAWLEASRLGQRDAVFVFSVGGGSVEKSVSVSLVRAVELARQRGAAVLGIVGRDGGYTARVADACVVVPTISPEHVTAHTEGFQAVLWHLLVSHPALKVNPTKWESVSTPG